MTQDRIDQISNDVAEDMNHSSHTKIELREVIKYWMNEASNTGVEYAAFRSKVICDLSVLTIKLSQKETK